MERATGIRGGIQRGSLLVGAPIGGVLGASFGASTALWLTSASFRVSAGLVALIVPATRRHSEGDERKRFFGDLAEGMRFIWNHRLVRAVVLTVLITNFLDAPFAVIMPVYAREAFGSAVDLGLMFGVFGGAALVGSLVFSLIGHRLPRRLTFVTCFLIWAVDYLVLATLPSLPVTLVALAVGGVAVGPLNPLLGTLIYGIVPPNLRGRVLGAVTSGAWAAIPAGILLGGVLVDAVGVSATLYGVGACYVAVCMYGFFNPAFREMDHLPRAEHPDTEHPESGPEHEPAPRLLDASRSGAPDS
jgi:predicted MFS family arabinose efflux permease